MIWCKKYYLFKYLLLFDRVFSGLLEETLTNNLFTYRSWFETFLYFLTGDGGGAPLKV